ncbi:MAG: DUF559 domain-containing protein [Flavobacteriales bacterium]|nr:MAG: DUF559 domain-containing protein [Flavobacteriales bacterium]
MPERYHNRTDQKGERQALRGMLTSSEATLWKALSGKQLDGRKFRRQHGIGPFIADLYCPSERLVIEVDGASHDNPTASANDGLRDEYMNAKNIRVLRIDNKSIIDDLPGVLDLIRSRFQP